MSRNIEQEQNDAVITTGENTVRPGDLVHGSFIAENGKKLRARVVASANPDIFLHGFPIKFEPVDE